MNHRESGHRPQDFKAPEQADGTPEATADIGRSRTIALERSFMDRVRGRARDVAKLLLIATTLSAGGLAAETRTAFAEEPPKASDRAVPGKAAEAEQKKTPEQMEQFKKDLTMNLLAELESIRNSMDEEFDAMEARDLIYMYSIELSGRLEGKTNPRDVMAALQYAMDMTGLYYDQAHGNKNGEVDIEDMNGYNSLLKESIGLRQFQELYTQYLQVYQSESKK